MTPEQKARLDAAIAAHHIALRNRGRVAAPAAEDELTDAETWTPESMMMPTITTSRREPFIDGWDRSPGTFNRFDNDWPSC